MDESLTVEDRAAPKTIEGPGIIAVALAVLVILVAIIVWQMAFYYGSRQSNDMSLSSPLGGAEVIQLRAQLQEARSFQTTLLSVVLASFAAGFTVLVVVNFAVLFIARRDYEREEKRMREFLILEAERRDDALASQARAELQDIRSQLNERIVQATEPLAKRERQLAGRVNKLLESTISHYETEMLLHKRIDEETASRKRQAWETSAADAERAGDYGEAARYRSLILQSEMETPGGYVSWSNIRQILQIVDNLEKIDEPLGVPHSTLATILEALKRAQTLEDLDEATSDDIVRGIEILESLQEQQGLPSHYFGDPSASPPPLRVPPTAPLRAPAPKPPATSEEETT